MVSGSVVPMPGVRTRASTGTEVRFEAVEAAYDGGGGRCTVVRNLDLVIEGGEFLCILGKTGCGKSTLLKMVLGDLDPAAGRVLAGGRAIGGPGAHCGYVPQKYSLFPDRRVLDNVTFGPRTARLHSWSRLWPSGRRQLREMRGAAMSLLKRMGLDASVGRKYLYELSGGMQQRVAIAQALATNPSLLLMDEAFSALDAVTRISMQELILELWAERGTTILFVTHSIAEALTLGSRILVLSRAESDEGSQPARVALDLYSPWDWDLPVTARRNTREYTELTAQVEDATRGVTPSGEIPTKPSTRMAVLP